MTRRLVERVMRRVDRVEVDAPHTRRHIELAVGTFAHRWPGGVLVECGAYEGVSAAKFSHLADLLGTRLVVADSFQGLPVNDEPHTVDIRGNSIDGKFVGGAYAGSLETVRSTVARWGVPEVVDYLPGWFEDSLPGWSQPIGGVYVDVDLAASTRTVLECLWPCLLPGGAVVSQDGKFPLVIAEISRWLRTVDDAEVRGLGRSKIVRVRKR